MIELGTRFGSVIRSSVRPRAGPLRYDRQDAHRALAEATDVARSRSSRLASGAGGVGPDGEVAGELERSADRAAPGRGCGRRGVPRASGRVDSGSGATSGAGACRRSGQAGGGESRGRGGAGRDRGARPIGRASARGAPAATRPDRVRLFPRQRRSAAPARCRQTARRARSRVGASDIPRGARSGYVRRTRQHRLRCARGRGSRSSRARSAAAAATGRPRSRRLGAPVHGGTGWGCAGAPARPRGGQERGLDMVMRRSCAGSC